MDLDKDIPLEELKALQEWVAGEESQKSQGVVKSTKYKNLLKHVGKSDEEIKEMVVRWCAWGVPATQIALLLNMPVEVFVERFEAELTTGLSLVIGTLGDKVYDHAINSPNARVSLEASKFLLTKRGGEPFREASGNNIIIGDKINFQLPTPLEADKWSILADSVREGQKQEREAEVLEILDEKKAP